MSTCPRMPVGTRASHCSACHRTFSTVGNFDRHQKGSRANPPVCVDPAEIGLVSVERSWCAEVWQEPGDGNPWGDAA